MSAASPTNRDATMIVMQELVHRLSFVKKNYQGEWSTRLEDAVFNYATALVFGDTSLDASVDDQTRIEANRLICLAAHMVLCELDSSLIPIIDRRFATAYLKFQPELERLDITLPGMSTVKGFGAHCRTVKRYAATKQRKREAIAAARLNRNASDARVPTDHEITEAFANVTPADIVSVTS